VDVENIVRNGGRGMRYDVLREFACRDGALPVRLNAYLAFDGERARRDPDYRDRSLRFHFALRDVGFKVIEKSVQWYLNEDGVRVSKANSELDLAVDLLLQSAKLDRVVLASGDGDFTQVVRALQNVGCRVELLAFQNVSYELRCEADLFMSGYLIPGLLPLPHSSTSSARARRPGESASAPGGFASGSDSGEVRMRGPAWGELESRVRGTCYHFNADKGFGFLRYIVCLDNLAMTDPRGAGSPYRQAFFHYSNTRLTNAELNQLPSRDMVFEFTLDRGRVEGEMAAREVELVTRYQAFGTQEVRLDVRSVGYSESRTSLPVSPATATLPPAAATPLPPTRARPAEAEPED
jgi:uncharacterized LabA/DUF88 family protein